MVATKKEEEKGPARPRISRECWWRINAAAAAAKEKPEVYLETLINRALPPAFQGNISRETEARA
jgi:hypothetical protein